jgi:hypothetical protein
MTLAMAALFSLRTGPIDLTDAGLFGMPSMRQRPRYRARVDEVISMLDQLDITAYLVTADGAVQEWEQES